MFDRSTHRLRILYPIYGMLMFTVNQPNADSLFLTPAGSLARNVPVLKMTRVPLPERYPLLDHHFHWVNDFEELR
jgi:hypothetical protein